MPVERLTKPVLILGEGRDEAVLFEELVKHLHMSAHAECVQCGGSKQFRVQLETIMALPGFRNVSSLAVVRDAEADAASAADSVRGCLRDFGLAVPSGPMERAKGGSGPDTAFLIVPSGGKTGKMEDLVLEVLKDEHCWPCLTDFFSCLEHGGIDLRLDNEKRRVQAGLAALPGTHLARNIGEAAQKGLIPFDHAALAELRDLVNLVTT